jgi:hypothetical protein
MPGPLRPPWTAADERRHEGAPVEAWWFWGWTADADAGWFAGIELRDRQFDYWAGLVREHEPYLYIEELDGTDLRAGLEIKPKEMWADHQLDVPFEQWSVGNEARGVLLDDPTEAWNRAHGDAVPVTMDVEWGATDAPVALHVPAGAGGYAQDGEIDAEIELTEGVLRLVGPGHRVHVWGVPFVPGSFAMPVDRRGLRAPYRRSDGRLVDQVLTAAGWWGDEHHR